METAKAGDLVGCCGLYCGLCGKYQSKAPSRCLGCQIGEQHSYCSIWNCCVKKHRFATCTECEEIFECELFIRRKVADWIPAAGNLRRIKQDGLGNWLDEQRERQASLEELLRRFDGGRSMSRYCRACAELPLRAIGEAIEEAERRLPALKIDESDMKSKAKLMKAILADAELRMNE